MHGSFFVSPTIPTSPPMVAVWKFYRQDYGLTYYGLSYVDK